MEEDSDDEDSDDEEQEQEQEGEEEGQRDAEGASGRGGGEEPQQEQVEPAATTGPPLDQPSASGAEEQGLPPQPDSASLEEQAGGPAGDLEEQADPVSPSAGAPGLGLAGPAGEAGGGKAAADGSQQPRFGPQRMFMDVVVERVCDCDLETEEVQLQVIKALVHACTATTLAVHQASLLTAVKTIYTVSASVPHPPAHTCSCAFENVLWPPGSLSGHMCACICSRTGHNAAE